MKAKNKDNMQKEVLKQCVDKYLCYEGFKSRVKETSRGEEYGFS